MGLYLLPTFLFPQHSLLVPRVTLCSNLIGASDFLGQLADGTILLFLSMFDDKYQNEKYEITTGKSVDLPNWPSLSRDRPGLVPIYAD